MTFRLRLKSAAALLLPLILSQTLSSSLLYAQAQGGATVRIAGQPVFATLVNPDGGSVSERANTIQNNLDNALVAAQDKSPASVNIAYVQGLPVITLGGYQVVTVTSQDAQANKTTPALLAQQWANAIRNALSDQPSIHSYVSQLTDSSASNLSSGTNSPSAETNQPGFSPGNRSYDTYNSSYNNNIYPPNNYAANQGYAAPGQGAPLQGYRQGRIAYAQAGQIIPITLATSISTQVARAGDLIQANISQNINLGDSAIPAGSVVIGQVAEAEAGRRLARSGEIQVKFNRLRTPDGTETPISAHLVGGIAKYNQVGGAQSDTFKGEGMGNKLGSVAFRGLLGAGAGAALGTAVGAIAGGGGGAGAGAWSGTAIGGGLGAADSLLLRRGRDVTIPSGTQMQLQLDAPVSVAGVVPAGY